MDFTLRQLRYLIALAEAGHFGRAAEASRVSQPALSAQIRELEARLGVELVDRQARGVVLTPAGRETLARARRVIEEAQALDAAARGARRGFGGRLRLGIIPTIAPYLLPAALPALRDRDEGLDLGVREAQTHGLLAELASGALDAAVIALPAATPEVAVRPLFEDRFLLAGSTRDLAAFGLEAPRPEAVDPGRLLLLEDGHCLADQALAACSVPRGAARLDMRAASLATLCRLAAAGLGLTLLPEIAARAELAAAPALAARCFCEPQPARRIALVRRRAGGDAAWFEALAETLAAAAPRQDAADIPAASR
jgi:LysR family hydrogen peroxide-inducible transcriptional activator